LKKVIKISSNNSTDFLGLTISKATVDTDGGVIAGMERTSETRLRSLRLADELGTHEKMVEK
jgi:hypothetical protein